MTHRNSILVVIDPTAARQPALQRSIRLARALGASLELMSCDYDQHLAGGRSLAARTIRDARHEKRKLARRHMESLAAPLRDEGFEVGVDVRWGHPLDRGVLRKVAKLRPLLVAMHTRYRDEVRRASFTNTDWNLIRHCPAPLLLVRERELAPLPCIIAAVDPLHALDKAAGLDHAILTLATELTGTLGGRLEVVHAYDTAPAIAAAMGGATPIAAPVRELAAAVEQARRVALDRLLESYPIASEAVHVRQGLAAEQLVSLSRTFPADVVVMGALSRGSAQRALIGSTAERVLDCLPCDLLIVKPAGFAGAA